MNRYFYNGAWYTPKELSEISGVAAHTIRDRIRRGYPIEECVKLTPIHNSVKEFGEASYYEDWIGMSTSDLYTIYWNWCIREGHKPESKQGFSRQLKTMYPMLKTIPTKRGDRCSRIIRLKG